MVVQQRVRLKKEERMAADIINTSAPLQHVRVLHLGVAWAGRVTSMLLADQGADVVEVLRPGHEPHACDPLLGRGKRLIEVDLKTCSGRAGTAEERPGLWTQRAELWPAYNEYQAKTSREIPVVVLERV